MMMISWMYWFLVWFAGRDIFLSSIKATLYNDIETIFNRKNEANIMIVFIIKAQIQ